MRSATYLRVSSDKQARAGTIDSQRREVPARCEREGWPIVREYVDDGASAATGNLANRPGLLALLRDAEARAFDVVVVYDLDRLTRADLLERSLILGTLARAGVLDRHPSTRLLGTPLEAIDRPARSYVGM